jgi:glycosyltransferase involved in cell wall biosynthesis
MVERDAYRALLRRARVYVTAPRREDYGIAQLEALADGCMLVTTAAPGPYVALEPARRLDPRLVGPDLAGALRFGLDTPRPGYAREAVAELEPFTAASVDRLVAERVLPLLTSAPA